MQVLLTQDVGEDGDDHGAFVDEFAPPGECAVENCGAESEDEDGNSAEEETEPNPRGEGARKISDSLSELLEEKQRRDAVRQGRRGVPKFGHGRMVDVGRLAEGNRSVTHQGQ